MTTRHGIVVSCTTNRSREATQCMSPARWWGLRDRGHNVYGPVDHGMCHSTYFIRLPCPSATHEDLYNMVLGVPDAVSSAPTDDTKPPVAAED